MAYDDDIHVYANPFLNPLSIESVGKLWQHSYKGLYIPLAYTILGGIALFARVPAQMMSSIGHVTTLSPVAFHIASMGFHAVNALLCYLLALPLIHSRTGALLCSMLFAVGLLGLCFRYRRRRPIAWLGSLMFATFLLPTLGLVPFSFQAHSTVADRHGYLPMIGIGLVLADVITTVRSKVATGTTWAAITVLAIVSFNQSGYWVDNADFLRHTIDVNPDVAFAHNSLGGILLKEKRVEEAVGHLKQSA